MHLETTNLAAPIQISTVEAAQILDSRGYPTIEVRLTLDDGSQQSASAPSGASTGAFEAVELRDGGRAFSGRSVHTVIAGITNELAPMLTSGPWSSLADVDAQMRALDGTHNLARLGANATVALSIAAARAFAHRSGLALHQWIARTSGRSELMPVPHFNVLNGGAHASNDLAFQEFMIAPVGAANEEHAVQIGAEVYHALAARIRAAYGTSGLGDEGGFAPPLASPEAALDLLVAAITDTGCTPGIDSVAIAIDPAANGFLVDDGYRVDGRVFDREQLTEYYAGLLNTYPLRSIEDGFAETDHAGWKLLFERAGDRTQLVGDDLFVTDATRIRDGARNGLANAALIKPNQIGTVTQTLAAIAAAQELGMACMVSHRSGETLDTFISDLVVGTGVGQIKAGAPARGERIAKYNRLMQIAALHPELGYGLSTEHDARSAR